MTPEQVAEIEAYISDYRVLSKKAPPLTYVAELLAYVRELEKDKARIDKMEAHLRSVMGNDWDTVAMEWDRVGILFTACMNSHPDKVESIRQAIDSAMGGNDDLGI